MKKHILMIKKNWNHEKMLLQEQKHILYIFSFLQVPVKKYGLIWITLKTKL